MKKYIISTFLLLIFLTSSPLTSNAQVSTYRYFSGPNGSYEFRSNSQGFAVPYGGNFQYYNGSPEEINRMMERLNELMEQYMQGNTFQNEPFFNNNGFSMSPTMPNFKAPQSNSNSNNLYAPQEPDVEPAPSYEDNPDIYY